MLSTQPDRLRNSVIVRVLLAACAAGAVMLVAACETTEGAGRDMKKLGNNIEDAAQDAK